MRRHLSLTLFVALLLTACSSFKVDVVPAPTPGPLPVCRSSGQYYRFCQRDLVSPDQQHHWPQECEDHGMDLDCQVLFPNGQKSAEYGWSLIWSPTNIYALVPRGGSHDTPSDGYELWNMLTATRKAILDPEGLIKWAPDGLSVFYLKYGSPDRTSIVLAQIDAATGTESVTRQCPDWLITTAATYHQWSPYCDNALASLKAPVILSFTVEPETIEAGESVTFHWTSQGGTVATLQHNMSGTLSDQMRVPVSGTLSMPSGREQHGSYSFILRLTNESGQSDVLGVSLWIE